MKRSYSNGSQQHNTVTYFVGTEVEHTAALGQRTLFVVGNQPAETTQSLAQTHDATHVYVGANKSFEPWSNLSDTVSQLLAAGLWVTVDFHSAHWQWCVQHLQTLLSHPRLILMISVEMPEVHTVNHNTVLKIDDVGMAETNSGVWCHSVNSLTTSSACTEWHCYTQDQIISQGDQQ